MQSDWSEILLPEANAGQHADVAKTTELKDVTKA